MNRKRDARGKRFRNQTSTASLSPVAANNKAFYSLYTAQLSISYSPDVFGLNRRTVESLAAQEQEVRFQMIAAYTTLTSTVVVTAIQVGAVQMQIDATHELIDSTANTWPARKGHARDNKSMSDSGDGNADWATLP